MMHDQIRVQWVASTMSMEKTDLTLAFFTEAFVQSMFGNIYSEHRGQYGGYRQKDCEGKFSCFENRLESSTFHAETGAYYQTARPPLSGSPRFQINFLDCIFLKGTNSATMRGPGGLQVVSGVHSELQKDLSVQNI